MKDKKDKSKKIKATESEKLVNQILTGKNTKALKQLEDILKKKIAKRINTTLNS